MANENLPREVIFALRQEHVPTEIVIALRHDHVDWLNRGLVKIPDWKTRRYTEWKKTLLHSAVSFRAPKCTQALIEKGADIHARDKDGWTAILYAKSVTTAQVLLDRGANLADCNDDGCNALHVILPEETPLLLFYLKRGEAKLFQRNNIGLTPLEDILRETNVNTAENAYWLKREMLWQQVLVLCVAQEHASNVWRLMPMDLIRMLSYFL